MDLTELGLGADGVLSNLNWEIATTADIDGDGRDNVLWRNKATGQNGVWDLEGSAVKGSSFLESLNKLDWQLVDALDVDGDRDIDLIWRNATTGQNAAWRMEQQGDSWVKSESYFLPTLSDLSWQVV